MNVMALRHVTYLSLLTMWLSACGSSNSGSSGNSELSSEALLAKKVELGEFLFEDENLSTPPGQSCASCHESDAGFADASTDVDSESPISEGAVTGEFGNRNAPTASYASLIPDFALVDRPNGAGQHYIGGLFVDGRAENLIEQAKGPFLNPQEMNNADESAVITKVRNATYADLFMEVYGQASLDDVSTAYHSLADAIASYESSEEFQPFSSKFDRSLAGELSLSEEEQRGLNVFTGEGLCASECHVIRPDGAPLFTDFTYRNIGTPANPNLSLPTDLGLGGVISEAQLRGRFRVPTLRNVALTAPYMHNGVFQTLEEVVSFYNTGSIDRCSDNPGLSGCWDDPEVNANIDTTLVGDLGLSRQQEADLVAFLKTLSD
jgi:cytochrome c peroxidase